MDKLGCGDGLSRGTVSIKKKERTQNEQDKTSLLKRSETSNVHGEISKI